MLDDAEKEEEEIEKFKGNMTEDDKNPVAANVTRVQGAGDCPETERGKSIIRACMVPGMTMQMIQMTDNHKRTNRSP